MSEEFYYNNHTIVECSFDEEDETIDYDLPWFRSEKIIVKKAKNIKVFLFLDLCDWIEVTDKLTKKQLDYIREWCEQKLDEAG
jgi:hypothetical protein